MKTTEIFAAAAMLLGIFVSCQKEEAGIEENPVNYGEAIAPHTVSIKANFGNATKTIITQDLEGHLKGEWEAGDVLYVKEIVEGVSSDPELDDIYSSSSFVQTDPLAAGGPTATFTATFEPYYWESTFSAEELAKYTFTYRYLACSFNPYYMMDQGSEEERFSLMINPNQTVHAGGYSTADDMLVSTYSEYSSRPSEISFSFARLGTIVKITLSGLQEGDRLVEGTFYTGDKMLPVVNLEEVICYYPKTGTYRFEVQDYMEDMLGPCHQINFTSDPVNSAVANAEGKMELYLRILSGVCDDWFGLQCTVDRGGETYDYSKLVNLAAMDKKLTFKEGGLTYFEVGMKPAVVETPVIMYAVPKPRTSFIAAWPADPHASGYECFYRRYGDWYDDELGDYVDYDKVPLTPVAGSGELDGRMYTVEVPSGLEPDKYLLYVRPIPDGDSGLKNLSFTEKELYVGITQDIDWPNVDSYGSRFHLDKSLGSIWKIYKDGEELFPWYFNATNVKTNWGYLFAENTNLAWTLSTCTESSLQHDGEIDHITLKMSKTRKDPGTGNYVEYVNTARVYGIAPDGTAIEIAQPEAESWSNSDKCYNYDFTVGSYNGFRIEGASDLQFTLLRIYYYAPTGE